ncbi:MAG: hypothetical protein ACFNTA_10595 [Campylobacter sp.]|uniref:hypothetical protein n=1 Tax=Campylobacter sp. TaxID=205 RepID=UPI0036200A45
MHFQTALLGVSLVSRVNLTDDSPNYAKSTKSYKNKTAPIIVYLASVNHHPLNAPPIKRG